MFPVTALNLRRGATKCWESRRSVATLISGSKISRGVNPDTRALRDVESQLVTERLKKEVEEMNLHLPGFRPGLVVLQVGDRDDSNLYISMKLKAAARIGINANHIRLPRTATEDEVLQSIKLFNEDPDVHGLIVQLPLDSIKPINSDKVTNAVDPDKDVDGLCSVNAGKLARGDLQNCFIPCTPNGCMELLRHTGVSVSGKKAVVIGRSKIVGAPMHDLLVWNHATVTCCHSRTSDLPAEVKVADILVVGAGKAEMLKGDWIKEGAVVIDVGINYVPDSSRASGMRVVGDVHFPSAKERAAFITPVPGGVGPMTVAMLMENTVKSAKRFLRRSRPGKQGVMDTKPKPRKPQSSDDRITGSLSQEIQPYDGGRGRGSKPLDKQPDGKYMAVTGSTSAPLTESRSTVTLGLAQAFGGHLRLNAFRPPSLQLCLGARASSGLITDTITACSHYQDTLSDQALFDLLLPVRDDGRVFSSSRLRRLQGTPVFLHISPLADVSWSSPSIMADRAALKLLGPQGFVENFSGVTCCSSGLRPHVLVSVTSPRALKMCAGGLPSPGIFLCLRDEEIINLELVEKGCVHMTRRFEAARAYGVAAVLAVDTFRCTTEGLGGMAFRGSEMVCDQRRRSGALESVRCSGWSEGGAGALELARGLQRAAEIHSTLHFTSELQMPVIEKIRKAAQQMFGAEDEA